MFLELATAFSKYFRSEYFCLFLWVKPPAEFLRYCSGECDSASPGSCPGGYRCYVGPNLDYCLKNFTPCESNTDCSVGEVCTVQYSDDGLSMITECRPALDPGGDPGDDCSSNPCANDICETSPEICTEVCSQLSDCTSQYLSSDTACVFRGYLVVPGQCGRDEQCPTGYSCTDSNCRGPVCTLDENCEDGYECDSVCVPKPGLSYIGICRISCGRDSDCPVSLVCMPAVLVDMSRVQGYCRSPFSGSPTGESCDQGCDHGICYNDTSSYCSQLCVEAVDCPVGMDCVPGPFSFGDLGSFPDTSTCVFP